MMAVSNAPAEYEYLKRFFVHWWLHLEPARKVVPPQINPANVLLASEARSSRSKLLPGLRQAVGDVLETYEDHAPDFIAKADAALAAAGATTLSALWIERSRKFKALLKRSKLRNEGEYRLIEDLLSNTTADIPTGERGTLNTMLRNYESRLKRKGPAEDSA